jgi:hypothetical protein
MYENGAELAIRSSVFLKNKQYQLFMHEKIVEGHDEATGRQRDSVGKRADEGIRVEPVVLAQQLQEFSEAPGAEELLSIGRPGPVLVLGLVDPSPFKLDVLATGLPERISRGRNNLDQEIRDVLDGALTVEASAD